MDDNNKRMSDILLLLSSKSRTQAWEHKILPILEKALGRKLVLPKRKIGSVEEFFTLFPETKEVMLDGMERPTVKSKNQTRNEFGMPWLANVRVVYCVRLCGLENFVIRGI